MNDETYKIYTYNNEFKNKVVFRSEHWRKLIESNPLYAQLFIEEVVDLDKLPTGIPTSPPPGYADWDLWFLKVKEELRSLKDAKALAELQLKQEKEQKKLAEQQKKADLELKDKEIKGLNERINKEKENYSKLQESIKTSGSQFTKYQTIIDTQQETIRELGISKTQAEKDLIKKDEAYNELQSRKNKELLTKQQEIETLKLTGKNLTTDQQSLIDKHQQDLIQLQELHQAELTEKTNLYELTLDKISKADKEVAKLIGVECPAWELKLKLAGLKPWLISTNLTATCDFIQEVYDRTLEIEEAVNENPITGEEKMKWLKKIEIEWTRANLLVILNELKFERKGTIEAIFIKQLIKTLKNDYLTSTEKLEELQQLVDNKKKLLLDNPNLLGYLNKWENLEGRPETKLIITSGSNSTSGSSTSGTSTPSVSDWQNPLDNIEKDDLIITIQNRLNEFGLTKQQFNNHALKKSYWGHSLNNITYEVLIKQSTIESEQQFEDLKEKLMSALTEFVVYYYTESGHFENQGTKNKEALEKYIAKYRTEIDLKVYEDNKDLINKVIAVEEIKTQILTILDGWKNGLGNSFEKIEVVLAIKNIADNVGNQQQQIKELDGLVKKYNHVDTELDKLLTDWKKLIPKEEKLTGKLIFQAREEPQCIEDKYNRQIRINLKTITDGLRAEGFELKKTGQQILLITFNQDKNDNLYNFVKKEIKGKIGVDITLNIVKANAINYWQDAGREAIELQHDTFDTIKVAPLPLDKYLNKLCEDIGGYIDDNKEINWLLIGKELIEIYPLEEVKKKITRIINFIENKVFVGEKEKERQHLASNELRKIIGLEAKSYVTKITFIPLKYEKLSNGYWKVETSLFYYSARTEQIAFIFFSDSEPIDKLLPILKKEYTVIGTLLETKWKENELVFKQLNSLVLSKKEMPIITDWTPILTELETFFKDKPTTLKEVIDKGKQILQEKGDPLAGIDLKGADYSQLTTENFGKNTTAIEELKGIKGKMERFSQADEKHPKHYRVLEAGRDGNCYLNSLANLLTGEKSREKEVAIKLRVRLILELMTNKDIMEHSYPLDEISHFNASDGEINDQNKLGWIIYKMIDGRDDINSPVSSDNPKWELVRNETYMSNDDLKYFVPFLKRPITVVYPAQGEEALDNEDAKDTGNFLVASCPDWGEPREVKNLQYEEPFFVYRLQGGAHFVPLVRLPNHKEGRIEFIAHEIKYGEEGQGNFYILWRFNTVEFKGFSHTTKLFLDDLDSKLSEKKALRLYLSEEEYERLLPKVKDYEDPETGETDNKLGRKWIIQVCDAGDEDADDRIQVERDEIHLDDINIEDVILVKETQEERLLRGRE